MKSFRRHRYRRAPRRYRQPQPQKRRQRGFMKPQRRKSLEERILTFTQNQKICIYNQVLREEVWMTLLSRLQTDVRIKLLVLVNVNFSDHHFRDLFSVLTARHNLQKIDLSQNDLTDEIYPLLSQLQRKMPRLQLCKIHHNAFTHYRKRNRFVESRHGNQK